MGHLDWDSLRFVLALSETGSYAAAGRALKVTHVTIMRRVAALESRLGVKLFHRSEQGFQATHAGREIAAYAASVSEGISSLERRLEGRDRKPQGTVRIATTDTLFHGFLAPQVKNLKAAFPGINCEISTDNRFLNLTKGEADIAIRPSNTPPDSLFGRRVANLAYAVHGAPWTSRNPSREPVMSRLPALIERFSWVGLSEDLQHTVPWQWLGRNIPGERICARFNSILAATHAITSGLGIGIAPCVLASDNTRLVPLSPVLPDCDTDVWILCHRDLKDLPRIRGVTSHLANAFRKASYQFDPRTAQSPLDRLLRGDEQVAKVES
ncbi:MAG: LysR family transcriptional regulator [Parvibaculaceae bacterium]